MANLIERQAAIDTVAKWLFDVFGIKESDGTATVFKRLRELPSVQPDVVPVVHGRWMPILSYNNTYKCSECGRLLVNITDGKNKVAKNYPYCHCGAKMDGKRKE